MSWGIQVGRRGAAAGAAAKEALEGAKKYSGSEPQHAVVDALAVVAEKFSEAFPNHIVVVESNGHIDSYNGYATFSAKVFHAGE